MNDAINRRLRDFTKKRQATANNYVQEAAPQTPTPETPADNSNKGGGALAPGEKKPPKKPAYSPLSDFQYNWQQANMSRLPDTAIPWEWQESWGGQPAYSTTPQFAQNYGASPAVGLYSPQANVANKNDQYEAIRRRLNMTPNMK